jgi:phosphate-selective porin OprO/OprP
VARVFAHPFQETTIGPLQGLGIGIATTYGRPEGAPGAIRAATGQTLFQFQTGTTFQGERARWSPQAYWFFGPFALLSEYVVNSTEFQNGVTTERARASAWQIAGAWVLTGENTSWRGVLPSESFDVATGGLGALELVARYARLSLDPDLFDGAVFLNPALYAEDTREWAVGVNWYLNRFVKLSFNYEHADFRNAEGESDNPSEGVFLTRLQLAY